jgi:cystathionine beta-synthase
VLQNPAVKNQPVESVMHEAFPYVDITTTVESLSTMITAEIPAVMVKDFKAGRNYIITRWDIAHAMMQ